MRNDGIFVWLGAGVGTEDVTFVAHGVYGQANVSFIFYFGSESAQYGIQSPGVMPQAAGGQAVTQEFAAHRIALVGD